MMKYLRKVIKVSFKRNKILSKFSDVEALLNTQKMISQKEKEDLFANNEVIAAMHTVPVVEDKTPITCFESEQPLMIENKVYALQTIPITYTERSVLKEEYDNFLFNIIRKEHLGRVIVTTARSSLFMRSDILIQGVSYNSLFNIIELFSTLGIKVEHEITEDSIENKVWFITLWISVDVLASSFLKKNNARRAEAF